MTQGMRYAFLPFLYDESGADIRRRNRGFLADGVSLPASEKLEPPAGQSPPVPVEAAS